MGLEIIRSFCFVLFCMNNYFVSKDIAADVDAVDRKVLRMITALSFAIFLELNYRFQCAKEIICKCRHNFCCCGLPLLVSQARLDMSNICEHARDFLFLSKIKSQISVQRT